MARKILTHTLEPTDTKPLSAVDVRDFLLCIERLPASARFEAFGQQGGVYKVHVHILEEDE